MLQQYVLYPAICAVSIEFHIAEKYILSLFTVEINPLSARNLMQSMEYENEVFTCTYYYISFSFCYN